MMWNYSQMIEWFSGKEGKNLLLFGDWGFEREAQRVTPTGDLALTDHPAAFGNKLHNPYITTDFAESQIEIITPPLSSIEEAFDKLVKIHDEVEQALGSERLWPLSMPPRLPEESLIRIAQYDDSTEGRANAEYREMLAQRYGKKMQMISGMHVNFSFKPELLHVLAQKIGQDKSHLRWDDIYFAMARNFLRYRWILIYLFGASPAADASYDNVLSDELTVIEQCHPGCYSPDDHKQYATSLRVSRYGYSNSNKQQLHVSFDSLEDHVKSFRQLLQSTISNEREFYSSIRLKPHLKKGEGYLEALAKRGVRYAEVRLIDLNPFVREGISLQQLRFLHVFIVYCLFEASPAITEEEYANINENHHLTSLCGRKPDLKLRHNEQGHIVMSDWMSYIFTRLLEVAQLLDGQNENKIYEETVGAEAVKIHDKHLIPSACIVREMTERNEDFITYGMRMTEALRTQSYSECV